MSQMFACWNGRSDRCRCWQVGCEMKRICLDTGLKFFSFLVFCLFAGFIFPVVIQGEQPSKGRESESAVMFIEADNLLASQKVLFSEIYEMVKADSLRLKPEGELSAAWIAKDDVSWSQREVAAPRLSDGASLAALPTGYPAGVLFPAQSGVNDIRTGMEAIWNIHGLWWGQKSLDLQFDLMEFGSLTRWVSGSLLRVYASAEMAESQPKQLWREKLSLSWPRRVQGLSWLTFRLFGEHDDLLWVYSPAIKKVRQLTGTNRFDGFMGPAVSLDDFLTWSGKPEAAVVVGVSRAGFLVPFLSSEAWPVALANGCRTIVTQVPLSKPSMPFDRTLNYDDGYRTVAEFLGKQPFFKRDLLIVEILNKDPYVLYGRQILYVDSKTFLPVYKVVFDRAGRQWKTVLTVWGVGQFQGGAWPYFPVATLIHDRKSATWVIEAYQRIRYCADFAPGESFGDLEPAKLGPAANRQ